MANSTASICIKPTVAFNHGDTFVFGSWVCTAGGAGSFQRCLTMTPNLKTGLVTLPEVITGDLSGKFGEISLYNQHADFEYGSTSNLYSTSPWAIACKPATEPSCADNPLHEHFPYSFCNASRAHAEALIARRAGKEIVYDYTSDSNPASGYYSDSSYEFDFGSDPDEPKSENSTTEQPVSGPATGLVITFTPTGRFVYWPGHKPADLTGGNSRCVAYLNSLPFQEGTPLAPAEEQTPTEVATIDCGLSTPDLQVFMAAGETPGPSGTLPNRYFEDISADELSANAPTDETNDDKNARRERNRKRNERRRRLRATLPIRNLSETLDQVEKWVHTTPEQCLMSITTIAHQAQGMCAGEVIAMLAEDVYFMRVDNRVTQVPPLRTREPDNHEATSRSPADNGRNRTRGELPQNPNRTRASAGGPSWVLIVPAAPAIVTALLIMVMPTAEAAAVRAPHTGLAGEPVAKAIAEAEATQTATSLVPHTVDMMPTAELKQYDARSPPRKAKMTASPPSLLDFAICFSQRNSSIWGSLSRTRSKTQSNGSGATPSQSKMLAATMIQSASTSPSVWTKLHLHGSSRSRSTRSTSWTSSRISSPATSRVPWGARVLAWTWLW
jgi:hypothetical protein